MSPAHALAPQDAADLAPFDGDARFFGGPCQGVEAPLSLSRFLASHHRPVPLRHEPAWRRLSHQRDQFAIVLGRQAARPSRFGPISQPVDALVIKAVQPTAHRLGTAMQFLGDGFHSLSIPAAGHDARMQDPVGWPVPAPCQFAHLFLFFFILGCSRAQNLRHCLPPSLKHSSFLFYHFLRNLALVYHMCPRKAFRKAFGLILVFGEAIVENFCGIQSLVKCNYRSPCNVNSTPEGDSGKTMPCLILLLLSSLDVPSLSPGGT